MAAPCTKNAPRPSRSQLGSSVAQRPAPRGLEVAIRRHQRRRKREDDAQVADLSD